MASASDLAEATRAADSVRASFCISETSSTAMRSILAIRSVIACAEGEVSLRLDTSSLSEPICLVASSSRLLSVSTSFSPDWCMIVSRLMYSLTSMGSYPLRVRVKFRVDSLVVVAVTGTPWKQVRKEWMDVSPRRV